MRRKPTVSSRTFLKLFLILAVLACAIVVPRLALRGQSLAASPVFSVERLMAEIRTLSSDEFQGRGPGTKGEELSIAYIQKQFRDAGLEPGNPDGTYLQAVPLVGTRPDPNMTLTFAGHRKTMKLAFEKDFVAQTRRTVDSVHLDADMIFAGYGVQAPEYKWDDFKGVDVRGKVIVVLINDPPVPDERMFGGKAMTYYGRWTYKYEKAAELGAAGCLIVHETDPAGYPWEVVRDSWGGEVFNLVAPDKNMHRAAVEGWITHEQAQELFRAAGLDYETEKKKAVSADFRPVPLGMKAQLDIHNTLRTIQSHNVIAKRTGSDPALKNQYVIYSAHWDHFGIGPEVNGDTDLSRRARQCLGNRGADRDCAGLRPAEAGKRAEENDPVSLRNSRRTGAARLGILRRASVISRIAHGGQYQHGRDERVGQDARHHRNREREVDPR